LQLDLSTSNLCFDDILLVPKHSKVESRSNVSLKTVIGNPNNPKAWISLETPIMTAPMEFINSNAMILKITQFGGMAFINRLQKDELRFAQVDSISKDINLLNQVGFAISLSESKDINFINKVLSYGVKILLLDIALGHMELATECIKHLRSLVPNNIHIMTGNVSSYEAYNNLINAGADSVRVGIGAGAACTTRIVTGFGVPVLGSIMDIYEKVDKNNVNGIIADGGIKQTGDIVKALAAGASAVMMGSFFAGHEECDGKENGQFIFRGISSKETKLTKLDKDSLSNDIHHVEGIQGYINNKGPIDNTLITIIDNIKSGFSYCGSNNIKHFQSNCKFITVSSETIKESGSRV